MHQKFFKLLTSLSLVMSLVFLGVFGYFYFMQKNNKDFLEGNNHVAVVLDVSKSMLVRDIGSESRLNAAKKEIQKLVKQNPTQQFALSIFAGESLRILPFSYDYDFFLTTLAGLDNNNIGEQGSNINRAFEDAYTSFGPEQTGTIVIYTDGTDENVILDEDLKNKIAKQDVSVYIIGVGTLEGDYIIEGFDPFGSPLYTMYQGETVRAVLNDFGLKYLASELGGKYLEFGEKISFIQDINSNTLIHKNYHIFLYISVIFWFFFVTLSIIPLYNKI